MAQWVPYENDPNGGIWEVSQDTPAVSYELPVRDKNGKTIHCLPKSEYVLIPTPERWVECTREVVDIVDNGQSLREFFAKDVFLPHHLTRYPVTLRPEYRLSWKDKALVIEKKVSG